MPSLLEKYEVPDAVKELDPSIPLVSPSQLNVYNRCAWSWHLRYVRGFFPIPTNDSSEVGLLIHHLLQVGYEHKQKVPTATSQELVIKVQEALLVLTKQELTIDQLFQLKRAGRIVKRYFETQAAEWDHGSHVLGVEKHFIVLLTTPTGKPFYLQGYVDLITAMKNGAVRVEDHKSTDNRKSFYTEWQVRMDSQLKSYVLALQELGWKCNDVAIRNYNSYDYKREFENKSNKDLFARTTDHYTSREIETFREEIGLLVDEAFFSHQPIRRTISRDCSRCWVKEACWMDMKGMDLTLLLANKYRRKELTETVKELIIGVDRSQKTE